ncbi:uncharacterized protein EV422DRAFT_507182 [Fimicolochytrium jonesii]|uniref:uncharacterized protein n=1 Tax=Fimicolochytrium jonesii TaxID=1396493 RepID=UPI0022FDF05E|nr:uncharacterized protein EV422DRAFT_507182 [Fimicolochytrium jonesii]KAI8820031.1 hypothetical protein EV422DRAFT_507182 [Fimicolochytrium jonesii]
MRAPYYLSVRVVLPVVSAEKLFHPPTHPTGDRTPSTEIFAPGTFEDRCQTCCFVPPAYTVLLVPNYILATAGGTWIVNAATSISTRTSSANDINALGRPLPQKAGRPTDATALLSPKNIGIYTSSLLQSRASRLFSYQTSIWVLFIIALCVLWVAPPALVSEWQKSWYETGQMSLESPEEEPKPIAGAGIQHDFNAISRRIPGGKAMPVFRRLLCGMRPGSDGEGSMYIFRNGQQYVNPIDQDRWKVGCTGSKVGVKKRMAQWGRQCGHSPVLIGEWKVNCHRLCENLIHSELKLKGRWLGNVQYDDASQYDQRRQQPVGGQQYDYRRADYLATGPLHGIRLIAPLGTANALNNGLRILQHATRARAFGYGTKDVRAVLVAQACPVKILGTVFALGGFSRGGSYPTQRIANGNTLSLGTSQAQRPLDPTAHRGVRVTFSVHNRAPLARSRCWESALALWSLIQLGSCAD